MTETALAIERTPDVIATEIISIREQGKKIVLMASIEIGKRLVEAKELVAHGEWGKFLEEKVDYSPRTANNLMQLYNEYGNSQMSLFGGSADSQAIANLSYTQAIALLGIPTHEREEFMQEHDVESMSTRELQAAIKARDDAERKLKEVEENSDEIMDELITVREESKKAKEEEDKLKKELKEVQRQLTEAINAGNSEKVGNLQSELAKTDIALKDAQSKITALEKQLKEKHIDIPAIVEKVPEDVERELNELRTKMKQFEEKAGKPEALLKFKVRFDTQVSGFQELLSILEEIKSAEPDAYEKYRSAVSGLLKKMLESL